MRRLDPAYNLLLPLLLGLSCTAGAQVYKSTDSEGNVIYSDTPSTGSEAVEVPEINVADPVEVPAQQTPTPPPPAVSNNDAPPEANYDYQPNQRYEDYDGGYYDYRARRRAARRMGRGRR